MPTLDIFQRELLSALRSDYYDFRLFARKLADVPFVNATVPRGRIANSARIGRCMASCVAVPTFNARRSIKGSSKRELRVASRTKSYDRFTGKPNGQKRAPNRLPIGCPMRAFQYIKVAIRTINSTIYVLRWSLITRGVAPCSRGDCGDSLLLHHPSRQNDDHVEKDSLL
jgi:hypothetical protein